MLYGRGETPLEVGPDGTVVIVREAKEVFEPKTLASFEGKSITIQHPKDFVSPENWKELTHGVVQNVRKGSGSQENDLVADFLITEKTAIGLVKNGLREVSCGYEAEYTQTGIGRGFQSNIIGNHVALVDEGRAGSSYAIHDHKGKGLEMTLAEKIKSIFAKAQDEALKVATTDMNTETPETKPGFVSHDDFKKWGDAFEVKWSDAFEEKMKGYMGSKDALTPPTQNQPAVAKDEPETEEQKKKKASDAREAWIDAQMAKEKEDTSDEDLDDGDTVTDDDDDMVTDEDEYKMTGDEKSRMEILAPGLKAKGKDAKRKALVAAYATKDGKAAIDLYTNGQSLEKENDGVINALFIGASESLKDKRSKDLSKTKTFDADEIRKSLNKGAITPEEINKINEKFFANRASN